MLGGFFCIVAYFAVEVKKEDMLINFIDIAIYQVYSICPLLPIQFKYYNCIGGICMDYFAIGQRIKRMRKARELSQENLAEFAEISTVHMSHIENGKTKLSLPVLVAIADALDVRVDSLLYDEPRGSASIAVDEIAAILDTCDAKQAAFIADLVRAAKESLDAYQSR